MLHDSPIEEKFRHVLRKIFQEILKKVSQVQPNHEENRQKDPQLRRMRLLINFQFIFIFICLNLFFEEMIK
jgi:hypothetical protein